MSAVSYVADVAGCMHSQVGALGFSVPMNQMFSGRSLPEVCAGLGRIRAPTSPDEPARLCDLAA